MLRPCLEPGCPELTDRTRCPTHTKQQATHRKLTGYTGQRGSTRRWRKTRAQAIRRDNGQCRECGTTDRLTVHHRDGNPANDQAANLATLCEPCHIKAEQQKGAA